MHFRVQIRAILRAAVDRKIDIVLPMISGVGEVLKSRAIIDEERKNLTKEGIDGWRTKIRRDDRDAVGGSDRPRDRGKC